MEMDKMRMLPRKTQPARMAHYTFILWGDNFEEEVATIFATELRRTGIGIKIVGLTGLQATGALGVIIASDLTLGQALPLADKAVCVIVPCSAATLQRSEDDPRVSQFFQQAFTNCAHFIVSHISVIAQTSLRLLATPTAQFSIYTESNDLMELARATAVSLSTQHESNSGRYAT